MRRVLCICSLIPSIPLETKILILMHHRELKTTTNTGRLAALALPNSEIRIRGKTTAPLDLSDLQTSGQKILLLYPSEDAHELTPEFVATLERPITLVVPDGNWRQAAKVGQREPALATATRVKLAPGPLSEYRLRAEPKAEGLATLEAIARALGVLESIRVRTQIETFFRIMVERTLWSRGLLKAEDCTGGIPPEALVKR